MPEQISEEVKEDRRAQLMELQQEIAFAAAADMAGTVVTAMIEGKVADEEAYVARTYKDAPNVVKITASYEYDLIGELEDEFT